MSGYQEFFKKSQAVRAQSQTNSNRKKKIKRLESFSWGLAIFSLGLVGASLAVFNFSEEDLNGLLDRIEISAFGGAEASEKKSDEKSKSPESKSHDSKKGEDPKKDASNKKEGGKPEEKAAAPSGEKGEKSAAADGDKGEKPSGPKKSWTAEEVSLFTKLEERKKQIEAKGQDLAKLEEELQKQKEELAKRMVQLEAIRGKISGQLEDRVKADSQKVDSLISIYQNMKAAQAAKILETLNEDLAIEVIMKMKTKNASEILNVMDSQKAKKLAEKFTGYKDLTLNK